MDDCPQVEHVDDVGDCPCRRCVSARKNERALRALFEPGPLPTDLSDP